MTIAHCGWRLDRVRAAVLAGKKLGNPMVIFRVCANNVLVPTPKERMAAEPSWIVCYHSFRRGYDRSGDGAFLGRPGKLLPLPVVSPPWKTRRHKAWGKLVNYLMLWREWGLADGERSALCAWPRFVFNNTRLSESGTCLRTLYLPSFVFFRKLKWYIRTFF